MTVTRENIEPAIPDVVDGLDADDVILRAGSNEGGDDG